MSSLFTTISKALVKQYEGELLEDKYHGRGIAQFHTGNVYKGQFENGNFSGQGIHIWRDGVTFLGKFKDNKIIGQGKYTWADGSTYVGDVYHGKRNGQGVFVVADQEYEGQWKSGKPHGHGTCKYKCGSFYTGEWNMGKKHGFGRMQYRSGNVYEGEWKDNIKFGQGKMEWKDRNETYSGAWKDGKPHGIGEYVWKTKVKNKHQYPFQNIYKGTLDLLGEWANGKREGKGVFTYSTGAFYDGEWKENQKHGKGRYVSQNGRVYEGLFENDRPVEEIVIFDNDIPFQFHLHTETDPESQKRELLALNSVVRRYASTLRQFYEKYVKITTEMTKDETKQVVTRVVIWKMLRDIALLKYGHTIATLDRAYAELFKDNPVYGYRYHEPHQTHTEFVYHDFLEYLIHISFVLFKGHSDLSIHETGIVATFSYLVKMHILPSFEPKEPEENVKEGDEGVESINKELFEIHKEQIELIFNQTSRYCSQRLPESQKDVTITYRDFALMLKRYTIFSFFEGIPMKDVIDQFSKVLPSITDGFNLDHQVKLTYEMVLADFEIVVQKCATLTVRPLLARIHRLKTKGVEFDAVPIISTTKAICDDGAPVKPSSATGGRKSFNGLATLPQTEKGLKKKESSKKPKAEELLDVKEQVIDEPKPEVVQPDPTLSLEEIQVILKDRRQELRQTMEKYYTFLFEQHQEFQKCQEMIEAGTHRKQHRIALEQAAMVAKTRFFKSQSISFSSRDELQVRKSTLDLAQLLADSE